MTGFSNLNQLIVRSGTNRSDNLRRVAAGDLHEDSTNMADTQSGPGWSDAQWELISTTVTEAFDKASVAGKFLPCYGPLPERDDYVRKEEVKRSGNEVSVTDDTTLKLFTLTVKVPLSREQVRDESLSSALLAFRRAAIVLAQVEDNLVFNGFAIGSGLPGGRARKVERQAHPRKELVADVVTSSPHELVGLVPDAPDTPPADSYKNRKEPTEELITEINAAIGRLEDQAHPGPFACILGTTRFDAAHTPVEKSMVLPADRIKPLLKGPLLRSGQIDPAAGIVVSLSGASIDLVVATPPRVQFLQVRGDAKYLFRVYEKFTMRIKDEDAIEPLPRDDRSPRESYGTGPAHAARPKAKSHKAPRARTTRNRPPR